KMQLRLRITVIEASEHLSRGDPVSFLDRGLSQLTGDLRGNSRLAARDDIPGGIQYGHLGTDGAQWCRGDGFYRYHSAPAHVPADTRERQQQQQDQGDHQPWPALSGA